MYKWMTTIMALTVVLAGCGAAEEPAEPNSQRNMPEQQQAETAMDQQAAKTVEVELDDYYFEPNKITVPQGKPVTFVLHNEGKKEHDFIIEALDVHTDVAPGKTKKVTVKAKESGTYQIICEYHHNQGMSGKLTVK